MNRQLKKSVGVPTIPKNSKKGSIICFDSVLKEQPLLWYNAFSVEIEMNANYFDNPDQALLKNRKIIILLTELRINICLFQRVIPNLKGRLFGRGFQGQFW